MLQIMETTGCRSLKITAHLSGRLEVPNIFQSMGSGGGGGWDGLC